MEQALLRQRDSRIPVLAPRRLCDRNLVKIKVSYDELFRILVFRPGDDPSFGTIYAGEATAVHWLVFQRCRAFSDPYHSAGTFGKVALHIHDLIPGRGTIHDRRATQDKRRTLDSDNAALHVAIRRGSGEPGSLIGHFGVTTCNAGRMRCSLYGQEAT